MTIRICCVIAVIAKAEEDILILLLIIILFYLFPFKERVSYAFFNTYVIDMCSYIAEKL